MTLRHEQVLALHRQYEEGRSLKQLGRDLEISHESVRQLFIKHNLSRLTPEERFEQQRAAHRRRVEENRERVLTHYKQLGSIDLTATTLELPRKLVGEIVRTLPNRVTYQHKPNSRVYTDEELIQHVQLAAQVGGQPLSAATYRRLAPELGLASFDTLSRAFGSFRGALSRADVRGNAPPTRAYKSISLEECVDAVGRCIDALGGERVSYNTYLLWASDKDVPSGATVRKRGWNKVVGLALERKA